MLHTPTTTMIILYDHEYVGVLDIPLAPQSVEAYEGLINRTQQQIADWRSGKKEDYDAPDSEEEAIHRTTVNVANLIGTFNRVVSEGKRIGLENIAKELHQELIIQTYAVVFSSPNVVRHFSTYARLGHNIHIVIPDKPQPDLIVEWVDPKTNTTVEDMQGQ